MRVFSHLVIAAFALTSFESSYALNVNDLRFYAGLENTLEPLPIGDTVNIISDNGAAFVGGIRGQALQTGGDGGRGGAYDWVSYLDPNIVPEDAGTLSFWMKPLDWVVKDGINHNLARFKFSGYEAYVYFYYSGNIWVFIKNLSDGKVITCGHAHLDTAFMDFTKWTLFAFTWDHGKIALYVNGQATGSITDDVPQFGKSQGFGIGEETSSLTGFDEVMTFSKALTPLEVQVLYMRAQKADAPNLITATPALDPLTIDGKFEEKTWSDAPLARGWMEPLLGIANADSTEWSVTYDADNLYLGWKAPVPEAYRINPTKYVGSSVSRSVTNRDGDITLDDSVVVCIRIPGKPDVYQFGIGASGARLDSLNGSVAWNADWQGACIDNDREWTGEIKIPFAVLGIRSPQVGQEIDFNIAHHARQVEKLDSVWMFSGDSPVGFGKLRFGSNGEVVRQLQHADPSLGSIGLEFGLGNRSREIEKNMVSVSILQNNFTYLNEEPPPEAIYSESKTVTIPSDQNARVEFRHSLLEHVAGVLKSEVVNSQNVPIARQRQLFLFAPETQFSASYLPSSKRLKLSISAGAEAVKAGVSAKLEVHRLGDDKVRFERIELIDSLTKEAELEVSGLEAGLYEVSLQLIRGNEKVGAQNRCKFEVQSDPDWLNNRIGIVDYVPAPWTPVQITPAVGKLPAKINVWGRVYEFQNELLPSQIYSQDKPLLVSPIVLRSGDTVASAGVPQIERVNDQRATITNKGTLQGCVVEISQWIEFDGFLWTTLKITPPSGGVTLSDLSVDIPLRAEQATLWYNGIYTPNSETGSVPLTPVLFAENFVMIGGEVSGIQFCQETTRGTNREHTGKIIPDKAQTLWKNFIFESSTVVNEPLEISFGIQATPVRPRPVDFREWRYGSDFKSGDFAKGKYFHMYNEKWLPHWNYPLASEDVIKGKKEQFARMRSNDQYQLIYLNMLYQEANSPEYAYWGEEWRARPSSRPSLLGLKPEDSTTFMVNLSNKSYVDWYLSGLKGLLEDVQGSGIYWDCSGFNSLANDGLGHGWKDEAGTWHQDLNILDTREFMKRAYIMLKEVNPEAWNTIHLSGHPHMAYASFSDAMIQGEQYTSFFRRMANVADYTPGYYESMDLDTFRAQYTARWGPVDIFLPEFTSFSRNYEEEIPWNDGSKNSYVEYLVGLILVNDSEVWPAWSNFAPYLRVYHIQNDFGWDRSIKFLPYWESPFYTSAKPLPDEVVISAFLRPEKAMLVIFNREKSSEGIDVKLDLNKLGLNNGAKIRDVDADRYKGHPATLVGNNLKVSVKNQNYRIVVIENPGSEASSKK